MNTKVILTGTLALGAAVAPVVIGRYGGEIAEHLRVDVLLGIGVVATLVALITLEYGRTAPKAARQPLALCRQPEGEVALRHQGGKLASLRKAAAATRAAA